MWHLFAWSDCENDWNTGGMHNYKGSYRTLEECYQQYAALVLSDSVSFGQIACITSAGLVIFGKREDRSSTTCTDFNRWLHGADLNLIK